VFGVCADVGPRGHEVELVRALMRQGPVRPHGESHRQEIDDVMTLGRGPLMMREQPGDVVLMTPVQGHRMLLRPRPGESLRMFTATWRRYYRECLRACGHVS
jgi:hypothetical protein